MRNLESLGLAVLLVSAAQAQTINVRGKVTSASGAPVANASVELVIANRKTTTAADGSYSLGVTALRGAAERGFGDMNLVKGVLELIVSRPAPAKIEIFDVGGNRLDRKELGNLSEGSYRLDLGGSLDAGNLLLVKASIGPQSKIFRFLPRSAGASSADVSMEMVSASGALLAKMAATVDSLKVSATGYATKSLAISSYDTTANVSLSAAGDDFWGGLKNPPGKSPGCGKSTTVTNGKHTITSGGQSRSYIIDIPTNYDMNKPYRFFYCSHWIGARAEDVVNQNYYFLKPLATAAGEPAIFIAPQALPGNPGGTWSTNNAIDNNLFMDLLGYVKSNLCIDTTRVFATGFSFGGMMTYSLSENRQHQIRAAVGIAPANYNIYVPPKAHLPMAWMQTTGMGDGTCPWVNSDAQQRGAKYIALGHAADNGCTIPAGNNVPSWTSGSHLCYDFSGCKTGYPVKACTFNGGHTNIQSDPGSRDNWIPQESWKFFSQF